MLGTIYKVVTSCHYPDIKLLTVLAGASNVIASSALKGSLVQICSQHQRRFEPSGDMGGKAQEIWVTNNVICCQCRNLYLCVSMKKWKRTYISS